MTLFKSKSTKLSTLKLTPTELPAAKFTAIWHIWDFLQANIPTAGHKPSWERVTTYPLEPRPLFRRWCSSTELVGVSFGATTGYFLSDIDIRSLYHPQNSRENFRLFLSCLETLGLVRPIIIQSSESGGLHIYFPLAAPVKTFHLAHLVRQTLEQAGLEIKAGQLELFPNTKTWKPQGQGISLYNAHRLPLQQGSYLLDSDLNPQGNDLEQFLTQWEQAAASQDQQILEWAIANTKIEKVTPITQARSRKAEIWYQDEQSRIQQGWTGPSQTNELLLSIGRFGRVFEGLEGEALLSYMVSQAKASPGYRQHCRHQHEIVLRCREWQQQVEQIYSPYRSRPKRPRRGTSNEQRTHQAQQRIKAAVAALEEHKELPQKIKARVQAITSYGIAAQTLYKYKELWYPGIYQQRCETSLPETDTANLGETPKSPERPPNGRFHTPPIRSLAQPEANPPQLKNTLVPDQTPRRPPLTDRGGQSSAASDQPANFQEDFKQESRGISPSPVPPSVPSQQDQTEFNEWFTLASRLGLVLDSEFEDDQIWVLTSTGDWLTWVVISSTFTVRRLRLLISQLE